MVHITVTVLKQYGTTMLEIITLFSVPVQRVFLWVTCQLCEPVKKLPKCRYFRDITWTLASGADNVTEQIVHCHCPRGAVAYLIKRQAVQAPHGLLGYRYSFACSPQSVSTLKCPLYRPLALRHCGKLTDSGVFGECLWEDVKGDWRNVHNLYSSRYKVRN